MVREKTFQLKSGRISDLQKKLLSWYHTNKRDLPFRATKDPYHIWLSEIMAQQTTMSAVVPYYQKFTQRFKSVRDVANADEQELLRYWQGLGYYSRIRNFQAACQMVMRDHDGVVPSRYQDLIKLKGVGSYTAAAIASICFGEAVAVVDGNVKRVLSRLYWYDLDPASKDAQVFFVTKANEHLPSKQPGDFNQAVMELGALVCTPKSPQCSICPVSQFCVARNHTPESLPLKKRLVFRDVVYTSVILSDGEDLILKSPDHQSLIQSMWELPSIYDSTVTSDVDGVCSRFGMKLASVNSVHSGAVKHAITNKKITNFYHAVSLKPSGLTKLARGGLKRIKIKDIDEIPLNTISRKILKSYFRKTTKDGDVS